MKKICIITTTRADYGLFHPLLKEIKEKSNFKIQILASGTHFSKEHGESYKEIENDGFNIDYKGIIEVKSGSVFESAGNISRYTEVFIKGLEILKPNIVIVLGDRYEILTAAQITVLLNIKLVHLYGGDVTLGANDNLFRNAITQLSQIHFVTNEISRQNIINMGFEFGNVHNVGSLGMNNILMVPVEEKTNFFEKIGFKFLAKNILVTFHPVTKTKYQSSLEQLEELLSAISEMPELGIIFTASNTDAEGEHMNKRIMEFCTQHLNSKFYENLGRVNYINAIRNVDAVVGNSSSLLYEVPALQKPSVNIGDRQEGRLLSDSIINVIPNSDEIKNAILQAFNLDCSQTQNPYESANTAEKILKILERI